MTQTLKEIHLAHTQGFCAGVSSAIEIVELGLQKYGTPLYVRHEIVHNTSIIKDFEKRGVIFIEELADVPDDKVVIFSAHGTAPDVFEAAKDRGLKVIDATCPLVTKVHRQATRFSKREVHTLLIGHRGHQELVGTSGYVKDHLRHIIEDEADIEALDLPADIEVGVLTQTTLSVRDTTHLIEKLQTKFPNLVTGGKEDICYATQNRQDSVLELAEICDLVIIVGSVASSNSNRLRETAQEAGIDSFIIDTPDEFSFDWLEGKKCLGISSGASVPWYLVEQLVDLIYEKYPQVNIQKKESTEKGIHFPLPKELSDYKLASQ
ncbi:4-hydroxy-3-methylbut-2-enyl diphosphate reductase [bacterium]|jgi:4-hydroxy-3-methylbut-2-en-1-yl diphosphate reductase|nr:4-hydroxy-3-methylbut-2-enyl diphosphate reductase [bacterium]